MVWPESNAQAELTLNLEKIYFFCIFFASSLPIRMLFSEGSIYCQME